MFESFTDHYPRSKPFCLPEEIEKTISNGSFKIFFPEKINWASNLITQEDVIALERGYSPFGVEEYGPYTKRDKDGFKIDT